MAGATGVNLNKGCVMGRMGKGRDESLFGRAKAQATNRVMGARARYRDDERGVVFVLALVIFTLMLMISGMAVDVVRMEANRIKLQQTNDRANLAAADLDQSLPPQQVVEDYFAKAGLSDYLLDVTVETGLNYKRLSANAQKQPRTNNQE